MASPEITTVPRQIVSPRPEPQVATGDQRRPCLGRRALVLALTTGALMWLCYFPVAWGWLAWLALVPLLALARSSAPRWTIYLSAWAGGLLFYLPAMQWMRVADPRMYFTWLFLAIYCSLYFPLAMWLIRVLDRRTPLPLVVAVPVVWVALELLRSTFGTGFAWYLLGHTQHDYLAVIQIADTTGAYGVSFLVAGVNALLFEILWSIRPVRVWLCGADAPPLWRRIGLLVQGAAVTTALFGTVIYGVHCLGQDCRKPGPRLALVQGNLDQRIRNDSAVSEDAARHVANHFIELSDLAARFRPDLIVWPETSYPEEWVCDANGVPNEHCREIARRMVARWRTNLLVGINSSVHAEDGHSRRHNSALLIGRDGKADDRYDKIHRVPFGEYVPLRDWLPWMNSFAPYDFDYSVWPGEQFTRFSLANPATKGNYTFGALICYEDTDADIARPYVRGREQVDFLLNLSNDGWFDGTSEHDEHLAICRFRAVECRRSVARSVNMGISVVIDGNGRVLRPQALPLPDGKVNPEDHVWMIGLNHEGTDELPVSEWHQYKKVPGVLLAVIPIDDRTSPYADLGDWLPWSCWVVVACGLVLALRRRKPATQAMDQ